MAYVDGYVLPVPTKNLRAYRRMAAKAGKIWREHGALEYRECAGDDVNTKFGLPFPKLMKRKRGETAVCSFIVFKAKAHRAKVNAAVMKDPRMGEPPDAKSMPFDMKRMAYGGSNVIVDA